MALAAIVAVLGLIQATALALPELGPYCPLNEDMCGWEIAGSICFKPFHHPKDFESAKHVCESFGTSDCPAKLLSVNFVDDVADVLMADAGSEPYLVDAYFDGEHFMDSTGRTIDRRVDKAEKMMGAMQRSYPYNPEAGDALCVNFDTGVLMAIDANDTVKKAYICQSCRKDLVICPDICETCDREREIPVLDVLITAGGVRYSSSSMDVYSINEVVATPLDAPSGLMCEVTDLPFTLVGGTISAVYGTPVVCGGIQMDVTPAAAQPTTQAVGRQTTQMETMMGYNPLMMGGTTLGGDSSGSPCWMLDHGTATWIELGEMSAIRISHHSVQIDEGAFWITGSVDSEMSIHTSDIFMASVGDFEEGPMLPGMEGWSSHCVAKVSDGIFVMSGGILNQNQAFLIDLASGNASSLPDIPSNRTDHACGVVLNPGSGNYDLVLAGGYDGMLGDAVDTVDILDLETEIWRQGQMLSDPLAQASSVPYGDSFLIIGGDDGDEEQSRFIFEYDIATESFRKRREKLPRGVEDHGGVILSSENLDCYWRS